MEDLNDLSRVYNDRRDTEERLSTRTRTHIAKAFSLCPALPPTTFTNEGMATNYVCVFFFFLFGFWHWRNLKRGTKTLSSRHLCRNYVERDYLNPHVPHTVRSTHIAQQLSSRYYFT